MACDVSPVVMFYFGGKIHFSGPKSMGWVGGWVSQVYEFVLDNDVFKPSQRSFFIAILPSPVALHVQ